MAHSISKGKVRGFVLDAVSGGPAVGLIVTLEASVDEGAGFASVGLLATDHAGYVSFSLQALRASGVTHVKDFRLLINGKAIPLQIGIDLSVAAPAFVLSLQEQWAKSSARFPAIQDPDDQDREVSPTSFSTPPIVVVGNDHCQQTVPGGLAGFDYSVYRVVRFPKKPSGTGNGGVDTHAHPSTGSSGSASSNLTEVVGMNEPLDATKLSTVQPAVVLQFRQRWTPIGQCLGDIMYSLPLAPGESRDLAIIDWTRTDALSRQDTVDLSEALLHQQTRDRTVEESINAGLQENQSGWSFLAGTAGAASGQIPTGGAPVSISGDHAVGVGYSSSQGSRDLAATSVQNLADVAAQATSVFRSQRSTVIVQASQAESSVIQTRTITNFNRSHALTVQYYEVLRNYRVQTEFVEATQAVLIPFELVSFDAAQALRWRSVLERRLLDKNLVKCFDALARRQHCPEGVDAPVEPTEPAKPSTKLKYYSVEFKTGDRGTWGAITVNLMDEQETRYPIFRKPTSDSVYGPVAPATNFLDLVAGSSRRFDRYTPKLPDKEVFLRTLTPEIDLATTKIVNVEIKWEQSNLNDAWKLDELELRAMTEDGVEVPILVKGESRLVGSPIMRAAATITGDDVVWVETASITPPPPVQDQPDPKEPEKSGSTDACCAALLIAHLNANQAYYSRIIWLGMDPTERRLRLLQSYGSAVVDMIDERPLAVSGNQVAFAIGANMLDEKEMEELVGNPAAEIRYVNVPARGVFAEAELGRCAATEKRDLSLADPFFPPRPPSITDVSPGPRGSIPDITPTPLPASVVQVNTPLAAPDPTGLAAAFQLLGQANIFRDMSGMKELSELLDGLASGAISLTEAQIKAANVKSSGVTKAPEKTEAQSSDAGSVPSGVSISDFADRISLMPEMKGLKDLGFTDEEIKDVATHQLYGTRPTGGAQPTVMTAKPKTDAVQVLIRVIDAWERPADSNIWVGFNDNALGPIDTLTTGIRTDRTSSSASTQGILTPVKGLTRGALDMRVQMMSETYESMSSELVDLSAANVAYNIPQGARWITFYARQAFEEVKVTVQSGDSLQNIVGSELSGKIGGEATIRKIVKASLELSGSHNWSEEYEKQQSTTKEFTMRVPKPTLSVTQVGP